MEAFKRLGINKSIMLAKKDSHTIYQLEWKKRDSKNRGVFWEMAVDSIYSKFNFEDNFLIFISPFHRVRYLGESLFDELCMLSEGSKVRKMGVTEGQDYLFMSSTKTSLFHSIIHDYYDQALKIFFSREKDYDWNIFLNDLQGIPIEELRYDLDFFDGILEVLYPSGRQAFLTIRTSTSPRL